LPERENSYDIRGHFTDWMASPGNVQNMRGNLLVTGDYELKKDMGIWGGLWHL